MPLYPSDEGKGVIRVDGLARSNVALQVRGVPLTCFYRHVAILCLDFICAACPLQTARAKVNLSKEEGELASRFGRIVDESEKDCA